MISARVIEASEWPDISCNMARVTTLEVVMPRIILAEQNTHRKFSRSTSSSRAISLGKMRAAVSAEPFIPARLYRNRRGMQAVEELTPVEYRAAARVIRRLLKQAVKAHEQLERLNVHKQWTNRYLEPWMWAKIVVTSTEWDNYFVQRDHPDAQPEMQEAARAIRVAIGGATHVVRKRHLPYIADDERDRPGVEWVSAYRCAAVSYTDPGQRYSWEEELAKGRELVENTPPHWSPLEHVAIAVPEFHLGGNFDAPWAQFRRWQEATRKHARLPNGGFHP